MPADVRELGCKQKEGNKDMNLIDVLVSNLAINMGIAPIDVVHHDANRALASLSPEDQRIAKRKFRKLWRSLARGMLATSGPKSVQRQLGLGAEFPTKSQKNNRKARVSLEIARRVREAMRPSAT